MTEAVTEIPCSPSYRPHKWEGRTFGKLMVIGQMDQRRILCRCDCGELLDVFRWNLLNGHTTECPKCRLVTRGIQKGAKFGTLTVTKVLSGTDVEVQCDCGAALQMRAPSLKKRKFCSTTCPEKRNPSKWVGMVVGQLTVLALSERPRYVVCRCDCGEEREVEQSNLTSGRTQSCGKKECKTP